MYLSDIRNRIKIATNYSPNDTAYDNWLNGLIDQTHREIWSSRPWVFSTAQVDIPIFGDKTSSKWGGTIAVVQGQTAITGTVDMFSPWDATQAIMLGGIEYTISSVLSKANATIDPPYRGETDSELATWSIFHRNIYMPKDCIDVIGVAWRDSPVPNATNLGSLVQLEAKSEADFGLSLQQTTGKPCVYTILPDVFIRTPEDILAPTLSLVTTSTPGYLGTGTYTFGYTYVLGAEDVDSYGLLPESDPWPSKVEITVSSSGTNTILFSVFQPASKYSASDKPYRVKIYYIRTNYDGRVEYQELRAENELGPLFAGTTGQVTIGADMFTPSVRPIRHPQHGGKTMCVRMWPRPTGDDYTVTATDPIDTYARSFVSVTYLKRPEHLILDSDTPQLPEEFAQLLIDKVVVEAHMQAGNLTASRIYEQRVEERMNLLVARYGGHSDALIVRGRSWGTAPNGRERRWYPQPAIWRPT